MDYSERAITGRVQAAAKLVLQDLDPEAKKRRQEFMSGKFLSRFYAPRIHGHGRLSKPGPSSNWSIRTDFVHETNDQSWIFSSAKSYIIFQTDFQRTRQSV